MIFNKVIMSRFLNKTTYSNTCTQKLSTDVFHRWFAESIDMIVTDMSGLNFQSMEVFEFLCFPAFLKSFYTLLYLLLVLFKIFTKIQ